MQQIPVSQLMRARSGDVIPESVTVREAAEILLSCDHAEIVTTDDGGNLTGIVHESAVIRTLMAGLGASPISTILVRHVDSVCQDAELGSVLPLFRSSCNAVVPVIDAATRTVSGLLYRQDIVRLLLEDADTAVESRQSSAAQSRVPQSPVGVDRPHFMKHTRSGLRNKNDQP